MTDFPSWKFCYVLKDPTNGTDPTDPRGTIDPADMADSTDLTDLTLSLIHI